MNSNFCYTMQVTCSFTSHLFTVQECSIEEVSDEEEPTPKSSKDKKANGPNKEPSLVFKITSKVPYKTVLKGMASFFRPANESWCFFAFLPFAFFFCQ